ncbi:hypothetical protein AVEN_241426-1, partial [Araneus ventricosus]
MAPKIFKRIRHGLRKLNCFKCAAKQNEPEDIPDTPMEQDFDEENMSCISSEYYDCDDKLSYASSDYYTCEEDITSYKDFE